MARPKKLGLEYFPLDVNFYRDIKVRKLMRTNGGGASITIYILLLCHIYETGYYMPWDEDLPFVLSEISGFDEETIQKIIETCLNVGLLDKRMYEEYGILTCHSLQARYFAAVKRRVVDLENLPYLYEDISKSELPQQDSEFLHTETPLMPTESTQSKVKESKGKNIPTTTTTTTRTREDGETEILTSTAVNNLKSNNGWLMQMQQRHGIDVKMLLLWLDEFLIDCSCRSKETHANLADVKRHFNDWLKKQPVKETKAPVTISPDKAKKLWNKCQAFLVQSVKVADADNPFYNASFADFDSARNMLTLYVDKKTYRDIEDHYIPVFRSTLKKHYGLLPVLNYKITEPCQKK